MSKYASLVIVRGTGDSDVVLTVVSGDLMSMGFPASNAGGSYSTAWNYLTTVLPSGTPALWQSLMASALGNHGLLAYGERVRLNLVQT